MVEKIQGESEASNRTSRPVWVRVEISQGRLPGGGGGAHTDEGRHLQRTRNGDYSPIGQINSI